MIALGVGLGRRGFAEQPAQVNEVLLRRGTFLQLRGVLGRRPVAKHFNCGFRGMPSTLS